RVVLLRAHAEASRPRAPPRRSPAPVTRTRPPLEHRSLPPRRRLPPRLAAGNPARAGLLHHTGASRRPPPALGPVLRPLRPVQPPPLPGGDAVCGSPPRQSEVLRRRTAPRAWRRGLVPLSPPLLSGGRRGDHERRQRGLLRRSGHGNREAARSPGR